MSTQYLLTTIDLAAKDYGYIKKAEYELDNFGLLENYVHELRKELGYHNLTLDDIGRDWKRLSSFILAGNRARLNALQRTTDHLRQT